MVEFHKTLSEQSVFSRYAGMMKLDQRVAHERLARICFNDYGREMALVVERTNGGEILGVGRLTKLPGTEDAEFALLISDAVQRQGLGAEVLERLVEVGRDWGLRRIVADILRGNGAMQHVCRQLGFTLHQGEGFGDSMVKAVKVLGQDGSQP
jgi:acetyltransferase